MPRESRQYRKRSRSRSPDSDNDGSKKKRSPERSKEKDKDKEKRRSRSRSKSKEKSRRSRSRSKSRERSRRSRSRERERDRSRRSRSRSRDRDRRRDRRSPPRRDRDRDRDRDRRPRRSRSRSRERNRRRRSRSRSRSPRRSKRSRSRGRRSQSNERSRSRSRTPSKDSKSKGSSSVKPEVTVKTEAKTEPEVKKETEVKQEVKIKEEKKEVKEVKEEKGLVLEQRRLEEEMQKRRERIERWRMERKKTMEAGPSKTEGGEGAEKADAPPQKPGKKWSLEDDDDADDEAEDETKGNKKPPPGTQDEKMDVDNKEDEKAAEEDDDIDPLDAFMMGVQAEVKKISSKDKKGPPAAESAVKTGNGNGTGEAPKFSIVTGVAKKKNVPVVAPVITADRKKGELMENDQDALEYSSEEEKESNLMDTMAALEQKKKKELAKVDHSKITYAPFRKDFYVEVPELARLTPEEVDKKRSDLEGVRVRGKGCPKPVDSWVQCGVSKRVLAILKKNNYEKPTPIQCQAIPAIMSGRDLIGIAKTGSGKTMAFLLPMFRHIMDQDPLEADDGPISVIMTPTRELAMQIFKECKKFTKAMGLRAVCVYGGTGISEQIAELKRGAEIIVCTPGRMIDMLGANNDDGDDIRDAAAAFIKGQRSGAKGHSDAEE